MRMWAAETAKTAMRVNSVNPGPTRTHKRAQAMPGEDPASISTAADVAAKIVPMASKNLEETGAIFDVPTGLWTSASLPQPVQ